MIVMTHMTNYGNDQLALYTISRLVNFVHRWTNLELKYASPIELADIYFNLFPKDKVPVWLVSPVNCSSLLKDLRHGSAHLEKFKLHFKSSPFVIRVNLPHP